MHVSQYSSCFQCLSIQDVLIYDLKHIGSFRDNFLRSTQIETWHICLFYLFVKYPMTPWTLKNLNYLSFMPEFSIFWCFLMFPKIQIKMNHYKSWYYRKNISRFQLNSWYKVAHLVYSPRHLFFFLFGGQNVNTVSHYHKLYSQLFYIWESRRSQREWISLTLRKPAAWSWCLPCQVSIPKSLPYFSSCSSGELEALSFDWPIMRMDVFTYRDHVSQYFLHHIFVELLLG